MKPKLYLIILGLLCLCSISLAQSPEPKTVTDFFFLLPDEHFSPYFNGEGQKPDLREYRQSIIKIDDTKNGYLRLEGAWEGWAEIAIFKRTNGKYIIGISEVGCGPVCGSEETFLEYENEKWSIITEEVLPKISDEQLKAAYKRRNITEDDEPGLVYELPRIGRTIKVRTDGGKDLTLFELTWNGTKFILKNK